MNNDQSKKDAASGQTRARSISSVSTEEPFHERFTDGLSKKLEKEGITSSEYDAWLFEPDQAEKRREIEFALARLMKPNYNDMFDNKHTDEIEALEAVFPELENVEHNVFELDIGVVVDSPPAKVTFATCRETHQITHLPTVRIRLEVGPDYPEHNPPSVEVSACWLVDQPKLRELEAKLLGEWDHDAALFAIIDQCRSSLELETSNLTLPDNLKPTILTFQAVSRQEEFNSHPFLCQICQSRKRGELCTSLQTCGHVFCTECLREYFGACVEQGYVNQVICPEPNCKSPLLTKSDLERLLSESQRQRLTKLRHKLILDADPNCAVTCPRKFCQALIRRNPDDNLTICPECDLAFCGVCYRSWHGYFEYCRIREPTKEVLERYIAADPSLRRDIETSWGKLNMRAFERSYLADKAFAEYMKENDNRACPTCYAPIEKSTGCNKMTCSVCHTFFCFLCGLVLDRGNPYDHYNEPKTPCYHKLFEGIDVDALNEQIGPVILD